MFINGWASAYLQLICHEMISLFSEIISRFHPQPLRLAIPKNNKIRCSTYVLLMLMDAAVCCYCKTSFYRNDFNFGTLNIHTLG